MSSRATGPVVTAAPQPGTAVPRPPEHQSLVARTAARQTPAPHGRGPSAARRRGHRRARHWRPARHRAPHGRRRGHLRARPAGGRAAGGAAGGPLGCAPRTLRRPCSRRGPRAAAPARPAADRPGQPSRPAAGGGRSAAGGRPGAHAGPPRRSRRSGAGGAGARAGARPRARCGPCGGGRRGWRVPHGCACAAGSRGSSHDGGCSAGRCACSRGRLRSVREWLQGVWLQSGAGPAAPYGARLDTDGVQSTGAGRAGQTRRHRHAERI